MTSELLQATLAHSVYNGDTPKGMTVAWSGAVDNVQFAILRKGNMVFVVFAGTNELKDCWRHLFVRREKIGEGILVHRGWLADFQKCIPVMYSTLRNLMENLSTQVTFLGHSYGGSLAQLAAWYYSHEISGCRVHLTTYGSPRVGNKGFAKDLDNRIHQHYRYAVKGDPVTHTPLAFRYKHGGTHILLPYHSSPHSMAGYLKSLNGEEQ